MPIRYAPCNKKPVEQSTGFIRWDTSYFPHQDQIIGSYTMIAMGTNIGKNIIVKPGYIYTGNPPRGIIKNNIGLKRNKITDDKLKKETIRFSKLSNK